MDDGLRQELLQEMQKDSEVEKVVKDFMLIMMKRYPCAFISEETLKHQNELSSLAELTLFGELREYMKKLEKRNYKIEKMIEKRKDK